MNPTQKQTTNKTNHRKIKIKKLKNFKKNGKKMERTKKEPRKFL